MATNEYSFQTRWVVPGTPEEISSLLQEPLELPRWWPSVYLSARQEGEVTHLCTRGFLPYRLRWSFRVQRSDPPRGFSLVAWGDLEGRGEWTFTPLSASHTEVLYDWHVVANKPILRHLSFLLKPLFQLNHDWAMSRGRKSLELELARRRGQQVPPPPGPANDVWFWLLVIVLVWMVMHR